MSTALATPGFPRSPEFVGSIEKMKTLGPDEAADRPFGLHFLALVTSRPDILRGLQYDPDRQQARTDTDLLPQAKGTKKTSHIYFDTNLDGCVVEDVASDVATD